jgi:hypothetical protein
MLLTNLNKHEVIYVSRQLKYCLGNVWVTYLGLACLVYQDHPIFPCAQMSIAFIVSKEILSHQQYNLVIFTFEGKHKCR